MRINRKAQISLEFLLISASFLSFLLLFLPLTINFTELGLFSLEIIKAESFLQRTERASNEAIIYNSTTTISERPAYEWKIYSEQNTLFVELGSERLNRIKRVSVELPAPFSIASKKFSKAIKIRVSKENSQLVLEFLD